MTERGGRFRGRSAGGSAGGSGVGLLVGAARLRKSAATADDIEVNVGLRPVTAADRPFLRAVFASTCGPELALLAGDDALHQRLLGTQFVQFERVLSATATDDYVITVDGGPAGRLALTRSATNVHVVDIALLTVHRGQGIGTAVLEFVIESATAMDRDVTLYVDKGNPARRLYERLGFDVIEENGLQLSCRLPAPARR